MGYLIYLEELKDAYRIAKEPQKIILEIDDRATNVLKSPPVSIQDAKWNQSYGFVTWQPDRIYFRVLSMHPCSFHKKISEGILDLQKLGNSKPTQNIVVQMFSSYNQQCMLKVVIKLCGPPTGSRNKMIAISDIHASQMAQINTIQRPKQQESKKSSRSEKGSCFSEASKFYDPHTLKSNVFFLGKCETKNVFSFFDKQGKGQHFDLIEKAIPKY